MAQTAVHKTLADVVVLKKNTQDVLHIVYIGPFLQHATEKAVLNIDGGLVENIAEQGLGGVVGSHAFHLNSWTTEQNRP
jgi:hypothetical protein